jgi:hypothetical protein
MTRLIRIIGAACLACGLSGNAFADTIAQWTFETSLPATAGPFAAEVGSGSALGSHVGAAVYSTPVGNGSAHSFSSTLWAVGDYYQFQVSTTGFNGVSLSWDQTSSNTGPRDFQLAYSTNGTTFTNFGSIYSVFANAAPNPLWGSATVQPLYNLSFDLSSITALNNQATAFFRLVDASTVAANGGAVGTGGTDRVDNFTVTATAAVAAVPEPETYAMLLAGFGLLGFAARRRNQ